MTEKSFVFNQKGNKLSRFIFQVTQIFSYSTTIFKLTFKECQKIYPVNIQQIKSQLWIGAAWQRHALYRLIGSVIWVVNGTCANGISLLSLNILYLVSLYFCAFKENEGLIGRRNTTTGCRLCWNTRMVIDCNYVLRVLRKRERTCCRTGSGSINPHWIMILCRAFLFNL